MRRNYKLFIKDILDAIEKIEKFVAGMDFAIHGYFVVDHQVVWKVIEEELPLLKPKIEKILQEEMKQSNIR